MISSELTAVLNEAWLGGLAGGGGDGVHGINNFLTLGHLSEDDVLTIEPGAGDEGDEELRAVGVWTSVGHGEEVRNGVLSFEVLIGELGTIDGLTTGSVLSSEVTTLSHEVSDDSVEGASLVGEGLAHLANTLLASAEGAEVLSSLGSVSKKLELDSASGLATNVDVKENSGVCHLTIYLFFKNSKETLSRTS